nr:MAG TPA: hypothetical protein [Caudoviricetes sp.]
MRTAAAWSFPCGGCFFVGRRRALRVALADFSATPWRGLEKSERCPSLASLFPPLAALVVVAVGSAAVRIHPPYEFSLVTKQKPQRTCIR